MDNALQSGVDALRAGDFPRAADLLSQAVRSNPGDVKARMALGAALGELQRWGEAIEALQGATALAPGMPAAHYNLGNALEKAGRGADARSAYRFTLELDPSHQRAADGLRRLIDHAPAPPPAAPPPAASYPAPPAAGGPQAPAWSTAPPGGAPEWPASWPGGWPGGQGAAAAPPPPSPYPAAYASPAAAAGDAAPPPAAEAPAAPPAEAPPPAAGGPSESAARALQYLSKPEFQKKNDEDQGPTLRDRAIEIGKKVVRPVMTLLVLAALGTGGYYGWYHLLGPGMIERETIKDANEKITAAYKKMELGLETPDARQLVDLVPSALDGPPTERDFKYKDFLLKKQALRCDIQVLKIDLRGMPENAELTTPVDAKVMLRVNVKGKDVMPVTGIHYQDWRRQNGKWSPEMDEGNWEAFGDAPFGFEPIPRLPVRR